MKVVEFLILHINQFFEGFGIDTSPVAGASIGEFVILFVVIVVAVLLLKRNNKDSLLR